MKKTYKRKQSSPNGKSGIEDTHRMLFYHFNNDNRKLVSHLLNPFYCDSTVCSNFNLLILVYIHMSH